MPLLLIKSKCSLLLFKKQTQKDGQKIALTIYVKNKLYTYPTSICSLKLYTYGILCTLS